MNTPGPGHNSGAQALAYADRLMRLEDEAKSFTEDIAELMREAKGSGIDPKRVKALAKLKRKGKEKAKQDLEVYEEYLATLDWLD